MPERRVWNLGWDLGSNPDRDKIHAAKSQTPKLIRQEANGLYYSSQRRKPDFMQTHLQRLILWLNDATTQSTDTESIRIRKFAAASIQFIGLIATRMWAVAFIALGYWNAAVINLISVSLDNY
jgi:hypothetical protein